MTFAALDLYKRYSTLCTLSDSGDLVGEVWRMPVDADQILALLAEVSAPETVAVEATLYRPGMPVTSARGLLRRSVELLLDDLPS